LIFQNNLAGCRSLNLRSLLLVACKVSALHMWLCPHRTG